MVACVCAPCVWIAYRGQKRELDPLELELQKVVTQYADAQNQNQILQMNSGPGYLAISQASIINSFINLIHRYVFVCMSPQAYKHSVCQGVYVKVR